MELEKEIQLIKKNNYGFDRLTAINYPIFFYSERNFNVIGRSGYYDIFYKIQMDGIYSSTFPRQSNKKQFAYFEDKERNERYIFGGKLYSNENIVVDELWKITSESKFELFKKNDLWPNPTKGATLFKYDDHLYLYGGINQKNETTNSFHRQKKKRKFLIF